MRHDKRRRDIKSKLVAAICMLLVSSIMMVSTTYAWFTLSTAPEVSGISTSVGANGNLEIALRQTGVDIDDIVSGTSDSMYASGKDAFTANVTWGNLVQLSDAAYGLNQIKLLPADLNARAEGEKVMLNLDKDAGEGKSMHLKTPVYGADGRVSELKANTSAVTFSAGTGFMYENKTTYGVRAIGTTSSVTPRQSAYRNYRNTAAGAADSARGAARDVLVTYGEKIANLAVAYGTGTKEFTQEHMEMLQSIITDLSATTGPVSYIESALKNYLQAMVVSAANNGDDVSDDIAIAAAQTLGSMTLEDIMKDSTVSSLIGNVTAWNDIYTKYLALQTTLQSAQAKIDETNDDTGPYDWTDISGILAYIADPDGMTVNGMTVDEIQKDIGAFAGEILSSGSLSIDVIVASGAGFFADVADFAGNYQVDIVVKDVVYNGTPLPNIPAKMYAQNSTPPTYLSTIGTAVLGLGEPVSNGDVSAVLEDTYGYIIDLVFRTNAANANLQLQTQAIDRIYQDNGTANADTVGHGSSMTFKIAEGFTKEKAAELVKCINVVFYDTDTGEVYGVAQLDSDAITDGEEGYVAPLYMMDYSFNATAGRLMVGDKKVEVEELIIPDGAEEYTVALITDATNASNVTVASGKAIEGTDYTLKLGNVTPATDYTVTYYVAGVDYEDGVYPSVKTNGAEVVIPAAEVTGNIHITSVVAGTVGEGGTTTEAEKKVDPTITALTQNTEKAVSVLVYLDGNKVTNGDVANGATSLTGTLNLQFSTNTALVPMEYSALQTETTAPATPEQGDDEGSGT